MRPWSASRLDPSARLVLSEVLRYGPIARAEIARRTGLSSGSLTRITKPLLAQGLIREGKPTPVDLGRPLLPLEAIPEAGAFIGVKLTQGEAHVVVLGLDGNVFKTVHIELDTSTPRSVANEFPKLVESLAAGRPISGIGVGLAAAVDRHGELRAAQLLGWPGGNLGRLISTKTGLPCVTVNDVDALALSEHWSSRDERANDFLVITIGEGIGVAAIVGGSLMLGHEGAAGMLGAAWLPDGTSFHDALSDAGIASRATAAAGIGLSRQEALTSELSEVQQVVAEAAAALGHLIGLACLAYGPGKVIITGEGYELANSRLPQVVEVLQQHQFYDVAAPELIVRPHDHYEWAAGAAVLALSKGLDIGPGCGNRIG